MHVMKKMERCLYNTDIGVQKYSKESRIKKKQTAQKKIEKNITLEYKKLLSFSLGSFYSTYK